MPPSPPLQRLCVNPLLLPILGTRRYAASRGDVAKLRTMLQQGFDPDSADYDGEGHPPPLSPPLPLP